MLKHKTLVIVTRYFWPIQNGLAHHTRLLIELLGNDFETCTVVCESNVNRKHLPTELTCSLMEFNSPRNVYTLLHSNMKASDTVVLFQYVPHMWGRAGVAPLASLLPMWSRLVHANLVISFLHELKYDWSWRPKELALALIHRVQLLLIGLGSHRVVVTNDVRYRELKGRWYWLMRNKVTRVPVGCVSGRKLREQNSEAAINRHPPYIVWFGTLSEDQKLEELVQAFIEARTECAGLTLVLIGDLPIASPRVRRIIDTVKECGLEDSVIFFGFVEETKLSVLLRGSMANFHVTASGPSGRRTVVAAYLQSGRPLVAVNGHETDPEFIHGINVYLVEPRMASIREAIVNLWSDDMLRRKLGAGATELYELVFSDDCVLDKLRKVVGRGRSNDRRMEAARG